MAHCACTTQTGKEVFPALPVGLTAVTLQVFSPDGKHLAAVGRDGLLRVYDVQTGQQVQALAVSPANPLLLFSPDGTRPGGPGRGHPAATLRLADGPGSLPPSKGPGMLVITAFSPDGTRLATLCDGDGALRLYDAQTGQEAMTFKAPVKLSSAAFSPDGTRLVAAGADGVVRVWTAPDDLAAHQKQRWQGLWDGSAGWHGSQAEECLHQHQWFAAAFHIERVMAAGRATGRTHFQRGQILIAQGKVEVARKDFAQGEWLRQSPSPSWSRPLLTRSWGSGTRSARSTPDSWPPQTRRPGTCAPRPRSAWNAAITPATKPRARLS